LILLNREYQTKLTRVSNDIKESQHVVNAWFVLDRILKFTTAFKFKLELEVLHLESKDIMSPKLICFEADRPGENTELYKTLTTVR